MVSLPEVSTYEPQSKRTAMGDGRKGGRGVARPVRRKRQSSGSDVDDNKKRKVNPKGVDMEKLLAPGSSDSEEFNPHYELTRFDKARIKREQESTGNQEATETIIVTKKEEDDYPPAKPSQQVQQQKGRQAEVSDTNPFDPPYAHKKKATTAFSKPSVTKKRAMDSDPDNDKNPPAGVTIFNQRRKTLKEVALKASLQDRILPPSATDQSGKIRGPRESDGTEPTGVKESSGSIYSGLKAARKRSNPNVQAKGAQRRDF